MTVQEGPEVHGRLSVDEVQEHVRAAVRGDADRQLVREVANGLARAVRRTSDAAARST